MGAWYITKIQPGRLISRFPPTLRIGVSIFSLVPSWWVGPIFSSLETSDGDSGFCRREKKTVEYTSDYNNKALIYLLRNTLVRRGSSRFSSFSEFKSWYFFCSLFIGCFHHIIWTDRCNLKSRMVRLGCEYERIGVMQAWQLICATTSTNFIAKKISWSRTLPFVQS